MIIISITNKNKTFIERIPNSETRIGVTPERYSEIEFTFAEKEDIEPFKEHFIYGYLESLSQSLDCPEFIRIAEKLDIKVHQEAEDVNVPSQ